MDPVNLASEIPAGEGRGFVWLVWRIVWIFRGIGWVVRELYEHPMIGIPVGILLICGLIVGVVRVVR